ncbi:hypothetical protein AB3S75_007303 [Citrus x aurantiifolia]
MQQQQDGSLSMSSAAVSFCPSFNSYASERIVNIAAKVSEEFRDEESKSESKVLVEEEEEEEEEYVDEDDEFEFVSTIADLDSRLFLDGEIRQVFPVFNRSLLLNEVCDDHDRGNERGHAAAALKKLFIGDHDDDDDDDDDAGRQASSSSSSSDEDEPEPEPEPNMNVTFCIWSPKRNNNPISSASPLQSPSRCKKSNSTGSSSSSTPSKKWFKLRDLLRRSNSDGKDSFVFLNKPKNNNNNNNKNSSSSSSSNNNNNNNADSSKEKKVKPGKSKSKAKTKAQAAAVSAHEAFYVKNRAIKQGDKKKSYLPYRQDLLGVFANYNGLAKTLPPSF